MPSTEKNYNSWLYSLDSFFYSDSTRNFHPILSPSLQPLVVFTGLALSQQLRAQFPSNLFYGHELVARHYNPWLYSTLDSFFYSGSGRNFRQICFTVSNLLPIFACGSSHSSSPVLSIHLPTYPTIEATSVHLIHTRSSHTRPLYAKFTLNDRSYHWWTRSFTATQGAIFV